MVPSHGIAWFFSGLLNVHTWWPLFQWCLPALTPTTTGGQQHQGTCDNRTGLYLYNPPSTTPPPPCFPTRTSVDSGLTNKKLISHKTAPPWYIDTSQYEASACPCLVALLRIICLRHSTWAARSDPWSCWQSRPARRPRWPPLRPCGRTRWSIY